MLRFVITGLIILGIFAYFWYSSSPDYKGQNVTQIWNSLQSEDTANSELPDDKGLFLAGKELPQTAPDAIRIATFNIELTPEKQADISAISRLAQVVSQFDVVALQGLETSNRSTLNSFMELLNRTGKRFTYVLGPKSNSSEHAHQFGFIYNHAKVACDTQNVYAVDDPDHIFHHPPVVAWFMTQSPKQEEAFTFSLVNVMVDSHDPRKELSVLGQLYRAVRDDSRNEDDVILLGDFRSADAGYKYLKRHARLDWIVKNKTTDTAGAHQNSNIIFYPAAAVEFTTQAGVFDFLKELNLSLEEAQRVSSQMPVWAEFKILEGNSPGRVASRLQRLN